MFLLVLHIVYTYIFIERLSQSHRESPASIVIVIALSAYRERYISPPLTPSIQWAEG